jgi:type II secretory pathway pseudopilin PulG
MMGLTKTRSKPFFRPVGARPAFTLAEALLAAVILAIVSATAALPFAAGIQQTNEAAKLEQAVELGQAMMEEVLARPFFEHDERTASPGPGAGETSRELFDNIDDFDGYAESDKVLRDFEDQVVADESLSGFWRSVSVDYVTLSGLGQAAGDTDSFVHVRVDVYYNNALLVTLDRIASRED